MYYIYSYCKANFFLDTSSISTFYFVSFSDRRRRAEAFESWQLLASVMVEEGAQKRRVLVGVDGGEESIYVPSHGVPTTAPGTLIFYSTSALHSSPLSQFDGRSKKMRILCLSI